jgi:hypothetical protein
MEEWMLEELVKQLCEEAQRTVSAYRRAEEVLIRADEARNRAEEAIDRSRRARADAAALRAWAESGFR